MPLSVESFAQLLLQDEARALGSLSHPVLVWSLARVPGESASYYEVKKQSGATGGFAMGVTVGRAQGNDILLNDVSVSRFHAYLQQLPQHEGWRIVDADSKNGTFLGPLKLSASTPYPLSDGSRLRFGDVELVFWEKNSFIAYVREQLRDEED